MSTMLTEALRAQVGWDAWLVPAAGLLAAGVITLLGRLYFWYASETTPESEATPESIPPSAHFRSDSSHTENKASNHVDRRLHPRYSVEPKEVLLVEADSRKVVATGLVLDRSLGGLGLLLNEQVHVGLRLRLRPTTAEPESPWVQVDIRYCRPRGDKWRAGCQFVEVSSWDVMNMFGPPDPDEENEMNSKKARARLQK